jgi:hypothetical protein
VQISCLDEGESMSTKKQQNEETTSKRDQLVAVVTEYKKTHEIYNDLAEFIYIKGLTGYSDDNCILILEQCDKRGMNPFDLAEIRGFSAWLDKGRCVRKGAKCFYILVPLLKHERDTESGVEVDSIRGYKAAFVFDRILASELTETGKCPAPSAGLVLT